jgi:hypothetical protein
MSIAWATGVLVVLLLPGFFFFWGFYAPHQVTRESVPSSPLGQLAGAVVVSFFVHALAYSVINSAMVCRAAQGWFAAVPCIDFDQLAAVLRIDGATLPGRPQRPLNGMFDAYAPWMLGYFALVAGAAFGLGLGGGSLVNKGWLPLMRHRYLFMLEEGRKREGAARRSQQTEARLVRAHVLSKTTHDDLVLIYDGILQDFYAKADGTISYIVLRGARSGTVKITSNQPRRAGDTTALEGDSSGDATTALLVLTSDDIANVYFEHLATVIKSPEEEAELARALQRYEAELAETAEDRAAAPPAAGAPPA